MADKIFLGLEKLFIGSYLVAMLLVFLSNSNEVNTVQIEIFIGILAVVICFRKKFHTLQLLFLFFHLL